MMVSFFEGQLTRTWIYQANPSSKKHTINLFHDTITGMRSAMLDFEEIPQSVGNSSLFISSQGHKILFNIMEKVDPESDEPLYFKVDGYIEIKKHGFTEFEYNCVIDDIIIKEMTHVITPTQGQIIYKIVINETILTKSDVDQDEHISWYYVETTRVADNVKTGVHRFVLIIAF